MPPTTKPARRESSTLKTSLVAFGTVIVAGVALGYVFDWHAHTCDVCGNTWRHLGAFNLGDPVSHTCRRCNTVQWWKDGVPHVFRAALREPPPDPDAERRERLAKLPPPYDHLMGKAPW